MHVQAVLAVLERVGLVHGGGRQLAGLAHRDEAGAEGVGDGHAEQEPARLDAAHAVDLAAEVADAVEVQAHGGVEGGGVVQHRGDIAEQNSRAREVGHAADQAGDLRVGDFAGGGGQGEGACLHDGTSDQGSRGGTVTVTPANICCHGPRSGAVMSRTSGVTEIWPCLTVQVSSPGCSSVSCGGPPIQK